MMTALHATGVLETPRPGPWRPVLLMGLAVAGASLFAVLGDGIVERVVQQYAGVAGNPYLVPGQAVLLYGLLPLVVTGSVVMLLAPGILGVLAWGRPAGLGELVLKGFGAAFAVHVLSLSVVAVLSPRPVARGIWLCALAAPGGIAWLALAVRASAGSWVPMPFTGRDARRIAWLLAIPAVATQCLLPVLFWQDLNPDGLEMLTMGRSLSEHVFPRLPKGELPVMSLGMVASGWPVHWFIRLFGLTEAAARLPMVLYLPVLWAGLLAAIEWRSPRTLRWFEELALTVALATFTVALAYNDTYEPYSADIASPAAIDFLAVVAMVAMVYFLWARQPGWFLGFVLLATFTRPTGLMFVLLLALGVAAASRTELRSRAPMLATGAVLSVAAGLAYHAMAQAWMGMDAATARSGLLERVRFLRFDDFGRIAYILVPGSLLPPLALLALRWQDEVARSVAVATLGYALFFYTMAFMALHHFAPAMVLPLIVFWRMAARRPADRAWGPALAAGVAAVVALWLAMPRSFAVDRSARTLAGSIHYAVGNYGGSYDEYRLAFVHKDLLYALFRPQGEVEDPARELIGTPWRLVHYSRPGPPGADTNYAVLPLDAGPLEGFIRVKSDGLAAVYVRDPERWRRDRFRPPATDGRSPLLDVPRTTLFQRWGLPAGVHQVDLMRVGRRLAGRPPDGRTKKPKRPPSPSSALTP